MLRCATTLVVLLRAAQVAATSSDAATMPWPGSQSVSTVDEANEFGENISGLDYSYASIGGSNMWAIKNNPSTLYKLSYVGGVWTAVDEDGWKNGKALRYPDGEGNPDTEDLVLINHEASIMYACAERNDAHKQDDISRLSILRYMLNETALDSTAPIVATHEWNVNSVMPSVGPNLGFEAITFVPDEYLVAGGLRDDNTGSLYSPSLYANHGEGLFFLGLEEDGNVYAMALNHEDTNDYTVVSTFNSGDSSVMALYFDRDVGYLWAECDNTCDNRHKVLTMDSKEGTFVARAVFERPEGMGNFNNEGFTVAPESMCSLSGVKDVLWCDDSNDDGHVIRVGTVPCGAFLDLEV